MLTTITVDALRKLTLGIRDHAALLSPVPEICAEVLERDDHTCHICGIRAPGGVEIDHLNGHVSCKAKDLKAICQFCHNLKHPLWAAARGRIVPIIAPDIAQVDLHRLSWALLAWRTEAPYGAQSEQVRKALMARSTLFKEKTSCQTAEALFEGILTEIRRLGSERAAPGIHALDALVRFVPLEALVEITQIDDPTAHQKASRLSTWSIGGFRKISITVAEALRAELPIPAEAVPQEASSQERGKEAAVPQAGADLLDEGDLI